MALDNRHQPAFPAGSQSIPHEQKGLTKLEYAALHLCVQAAIATVEECFAYANRFFDEAEKHKAPNAPTYVPAGWQGDQ